MFPFLSDLKLSRNCSYKINPSKKTFLYVDLSLSIHHSMYMYTVNVQLNLTPMIYCKIQCLASSDVL